MYPLYVLDCIYLARPDEEKSHIRQTAHPSIDRNKKTLAGNSTLLSSYRKEEEAFVFAGKMPVEKKPNSI